jgi:hypothetical protein
MPGGFATGHFLLVIAVSWQFGHSITIPFGPHFNRFLTSDELVRMEPIKSPVKKGVFQKPLEID